MMKYLFLMFAWWGVFTTDGFSADGWRIFADFKTDEVLAINGDIGSGVVDSATRIYYSINNGKYIPINILSSKMIEGEGPQIIAYFPAKPQERYELNVIGIFTCGTNIKCKNPDGSEQIFWFLGSDTTAIPTVQYGIFKYPFVNLYNQAEWWDLFVDDQTGEIIVFFRLRDGFHVMYKKSQSKSNKWIEMNIVSVNMANASLMASFPNDSNKKKYKIKSGNIKQPIVGGYLWVVNPDGSEQYFYRRFRDDMTFEESDKSASQTYFYLLGK